MSRGSLKALLLGLAIIGALAWYLVSPLYSMSRLREAAIGGDEVELAERIDFPALRESFKAELRARFEEEMNRKDVSDDPFAVMGRALAMGVIDPTVDSLVSPKGIAALFEYGQFDAPGARRPGDGEARPKPKWSIERDGFNRVLASPLEGGGDALALVFERDGLGWKLVGVDLGGEAPADAALD